MKNRRNIMIIVVSVLILIAGYFIYDYYKNQNQGAEPRTINSDANEFPQITVNGAIPYTTDESNYYNLNILRIGEDNMLEFQEFNGKIYVNNEEIKGNKPYKLSVETISEDNNIQITYVKDSGEQAEFYLRTMPDKFPKYFTEGQSTYEGEYYVCTYLNSPGHYIFKVNNSGALTFYKETNGLPFNFTKVTANDKIRYCYLEENTQVVPLDNAGYIPCDLVVLDENYNHLQTIRAKGNGILPDNYPLENHDFIYLDDNHYIISAYVSYEEANMPKEVYSGEGPVKVVAEVLQEIKDGEVIFQWQSSDYPELYIDSVENNDYNTPDKFNFDYCHFNSVTIDPKDDNLICSFRNLDEIIKIDRKTGDILWKLGGLGDQFNLDKETQGFAKQHYVKVVGEDTILFFNNGDEGDISSAVEISYDEANKTITNFKRYIGIDRFSPSMGSAQLISRENDVILTNYGNISDDRPLFYEVDFKTNEELFKFSFEGGLSGYRVQKYK